jgi:hypothetical protein
MDGPSGDIYLRAHGMGATKRQHQQKEEEEFLVQDTRGWQNASAIDTKIGRKFQEAHRRRKKMEKKIDGQQRNGNEVYDCKRRRNLLISLSPRRRVGSERPSKNPTVGCVPVEMQSIIDGTSIRQLYN